MNYFEVLSAGLMSTLQDRGRFSYQDCGVPPSGVMDDLSYAIANALTGNDAGEGVIEFTLTGPKLRLCGDSPCIFAVTGDAVVTLNDVHCAIYHSHQMNPGDVLHVQRVRSGARGYIAVAGGFDVQPQLGSVSTLSRARLGGFEGGPLQKAAKLPLRPLSEKRQYNITSDRIFPQREKRPVRVVPGPQDNYFDDVAWKLFTRQQYRLSTQCDRMGYRLIGDPVTHSRGFNIISDAISLGSIQIPGDGQPIIAMNDRQTTGGYPKIATVIRADLARLGQLKPGDSLSFEPITVSGAETLWCGRQKLLNDLCRKLRSAAKSTDK
ncbi:biotin-dependent carboxyltransferase family protein [Tatumella ptyseos]|uniref:5-oxoprolinase subunit C family protein n=1 Tax=Tatumella ptyseos TaxID=82987 RepID=UPI0023F3ED25|nr:biotin-dependent carboxyltransferase family protein [Tatumella ptyseos]